MQNKELIVISGAGQGIGKNIAFNLADKYDLLLISIELYNPPTLPGLILINLHAFTLIASCADFIEVILSSRQIGVSILLASSEWSNTSAKCKGCSIKIKFNLSISLKSAISSKEYPPLQSICNDLLRFRLKY